MSLPSLPGLNKSLYEGSEDSREGSAMLPPGMIPPGTPGSVTSSKSSPTGFAQELARVQEEQVVFLKKVEREKQRKQYLEQNIEEAKLSLRSIQDKTKNGNIVKDHDIVNQKLVNRLEYQLQMSKIKLSTARNENINLKRRVEDLRREKLLHLQILGDLHKEASAAKRRAKHCQKEVVLMNEKKHKVKVAIATIKQKMIRDMEEFSTELNKAKESIGNAQMSIMHTIREKLEQTSSFVYQPSSADSTFLRLPTRAGNTEFASRAGKRDSLPNTQALSPTRQVGHSQQDVDALLRDTEYQTVESLLTALLQSEETVFALYHDTQSKHEEVEKMELDNKHLEAKVQEQMKTLHVLEGQQEQVKQEVEKNIQTLKNMIAKYDVDYYRNVDILNGIADNLVSVLKNVAIDEAALDQQLLSTGVNDRNIQGFLGLIEQRIDDLIQMSKAAAHQAIKREDFLKMAADRPGGFQVPTPPSLFDANDDDDDPDADGARLQPLNIPMLKEIVHKKAQKLSTTGASVPIQPKKLDKFNLLAPAGLRSRQQSNSSIRSAESGKAFSDY